MSYRRFCLLCFVMLMYVCPFLQGQTQSVLLSRTDSTEVSQFVFVKGSTFLMGSADYQTDEQPQHWVRVTDFYIGRYEVTQHEWKQVMGSNPSQKKGDNLPVENVTYDMVLQFIDRLNSAGNKRFRLPTEAEWEYAARGGKDAKPYLYAGSDSVGEVAWQGMSIRYSPRDSAIGSHPVGQKAPNALGIYDMSGNVAEWCSDWYTPDYYTKSPRRNPTGPESGERRVIRGGGWYNESFFCRVSARFSAFPGDAEDHIGFRLVYTPPPH